MCEYNSLKNHGFRFIPQGTVENNLLPDRLFGQQAYILIIADTQHLHFIARPLSGSHKCAW